MTTIDDLVKRGLIFIGAAIVGIIIFCWQPFGNFSFPIAIIPIIGYMFILKRLKDQKRVGALLEKELDKLNYTILEERPLTVKEQFENYELDFGMNYMSGINTNSWLYKAKMLRRMIVKNEKDHYFELIVTVVQTWSDKIIYNINSTSRIRN